VQQCSTEGCMRPARRGNTICKVCYTKQWHERQGECSLGHCDRRIDAAGLCTLHGLVAEGDVAGIGEFGVRGAQSPWRMGRLAYRPGLTARARPKARPGPGRFIVIQKMGTWLSPYDLHTICTWPTSGRCVYE